MTSHYCLKCKKETPTKSIHYENLTRKTKTGKTIKQAVMRGICEVCGTKKTKFVKASENYSKIDPTEYKTESKQEQIQSSGLTYRVEKRDISKRTYTALKELIKHGNAGYLTFGNIKYYVSPANVEQFKKAHEKGVLKKAAQVMSGEAPIDKVKHKMKTSGAGLDNIGLLSDVLGVVGMLL